MNLHPLYVSATLQDSGKTSVSLGLMQALRDRGYQPGYIKPVGQRYIRHFGQNIDEDAFLFHRVFGLRDRPKLMSPIAIAKGFTRQFIENPVGHGLEEKILRCRDRLASRHDSLVVEGTGHAGVGSCFGLSNARVAQLLGGKAIVVATGGVGKPIDEVALSMALFEKRGIEVLGVVLNKVHEAKYERVVETVGKGLPLIGTRLLGAIPRVPTLTYYTVGQVAEEFGYEVFCGRRNLRNQISNTVVLAMQPEHSKRYIRQNSLVITPHDRVDNIRIAVATLRNFASSNGGIILSGSGKPDKEARAILSGCEVPVLLGREDTFTVSSRMVHLEFKITVSDGRKIEHLKSLVGKHVDLDYLVERLKNG
jgi:hypothetical protein